MLSYKQEYFLLCILSSLVATTDVINKWVMMRDIVYCVTILEHREFVLFHAERARNMRKTQNWISWKKKTSQVLFQTHFYKATCLALFTDANCSALMC